MADGKLVGRVEGGDVSDIGCCRTIVERRVRWVRNKCGSIGRDACIPRRAVVEILRVCIVGPELQAVREVATNIKLECAVVAGTALKSTMWCWPREDSP